jgi:two-component system chemotaxis response regulator CheB
VARRDIIVVGASADGLQMLRMLLAALPSNLPAAIFVVLHTGPTGGTVLPEILSRVGTLPAAPAVDGEPILPGRVYLPQPDTHLMVKNGFVRVTRGPRENRFRPAIDPLFRTAAAAYGPRVVGVVLSGLLDDGAYGLRQIVDGGGAAFVQDLHEATYPDMPRAALRQVPEAIPLRVHQIAERLVRLSAPTQEGNGDAWSTTRTAPPKIPSRRSRKTRRKVRSRSSPAPTAAAP